MPFLISLSNVLYISSDNLEQGLKGNHWYDSILSHYDIILQFGSLHVLMQILITEDVSSLNNNLLTQNKASGHNDVNAVHDASFVQYYIAFLLILQLTEPPKFLFLNVSDVSQSTWFIVTPSLYVLEDNLLDLLSEYFLEVLSS